MSTRKTKLAIVDPARYPHREIVIGGQAYKMCFSHEALALAEISLRAQGFEEVNILRPMLVRNLATMRMLFAVSLHVYHPELDYRVTCNWFTSQNAAEILSAVDEAWNLSHIDGSKAKPDPTQPVK